MTDQNENTPDKPTVFKSLVVLFKISGGLLFLQFCRAFYQPMNGHGAFILALLWSLPIWGCVAWGLAYGARHDIQGVKHLIVIGPIFTGTVLLPMAPAMVYYLNAVLDKGAETEALLPVKSIFMPFASHYDSYIAIVDSPEKPRLNTGLDHDLKVHLLHDEGSQTKPGDTIRLVYKPGYFGLPWIISTHTLSHDIQYGYIPSDTGQTQNRSR